ncbi:MAG: hypothetical protein VX777_07395 [Chlamydiota bacterium]|nr:hypothetical protein [Chlamydiota bacterium]
MKLLMALLVFLLTSSCSCLLDPMMKEKLKVYDQHMYRQYCHHKLVPNVFGGGGNGKQLHLLSLGFSTDQKLTIKTARKLLVDSISDFHEKINNSESLRPFLNEIPFPVSKLEYTIEVVEEGGWWPLFPDGLDDQQHISYVILSRGVVRYYIDIVKDKLPVEIHEETYEEAVAITLEKDL